MFRTLSPRGVKPFSSLFKQHLLYSLNVQVEQSPPTNSGYYPLNQLNQRHFSTMTQQSNPDTMKSTQDTSSDFLPGGDQTPVVAKHIPIKNQEALNKQIVLLGGGWGGYSFIRNVTLEGVDYDVHVVSPRNHFLFTPLLASATTGVVEFRSIVEHLRGARKQDNYHYHAAKCVSVDTDNQLIYCEPVYDKEKGNFAMRYDKLVVAVGCDVNAMNVKGVTEHALFLKELDHARRIRYSIIECFEKASNPLLSVQERSNLLHFIVVGSGPTGVELSAEIHDFIEQDMSKIFPDLYVDCKITILEASNIILGQFDRSLQEYTRKKFHKEHIAVHTGKRVSEVRKNMVILSDGSEIHCGLICWSAGIQARKLLQSNVATPNIPKDQMNRIKVDERLKVVGFDNIYAMGDCSTIETNPLAATAQVASQQGKYIARMLSKKSDTDEETKDDTFVYHHRGLMAYVGNYSAISQLEKGNIKLSGRTSFLVWRSAYLTQLLSIRNKILVPFDWTKALLFGRDTMNFKS